MANNITGRQWTLDTAGANLVWQGNIYIKQIEFVEYLLDTDVAVLMDAAGRVVWSANGASDLSVVRTGDIGWVDGLALTTLTQGKILVYIK